MNEFISYVYFAFMMVSSRHYLSRLNAIDADMGDILPCYQTSFIQRLLRCDFRSLELYASCSNIIVTFLSSVVLVEVSVTDIHF